MCLKLVQPSMLSNAQHMASFMGFRCMLVRCQALAAQHSTHTHTLPCFLRCSLSICCHMQDERHSLCLQAMSCCVVQAQLSLQ